MFGLKAVDFRDQVSLEVGARFEPMNVFAWAVHDNGPLGHIGEDWVNRIEVVAETLDVETDELASAATHVRRLSKDTALAFMSVYLPGINPVVLEGCVQPEPDEPEWQAVVRLAQDFDTYTPCFKEAHRLLDEAEAAYWESGEVSLDDGRDVPEQWWRIVRSHSRVPWPVP